MYLVFKKIKLFCYHIAQVRGMINFSEVGIIIFINKIWWG